MPGNLNSDCSYLITTVQQKLTPNKMNRFEIVLEIF